jgi:hypothetical protein
MAHIIGDWLLQTEWQAVNKDSNWKALAVHLLIYHVVVAIVLLWGFNIPPAQVGIVMVPLIVLHAVFDRRGFVRQLMRLLRLTVTREPGGWLIIAVDQSLHLLLLGATALYLSALP